jgi:hypothetical protein
LEDLAVDGMIILNAILEKQRNDSEGIEMAQNRVQAAGFLNTIKSFAIL